MRKRLSRWYPFAIWILGILSFRSSLADQYVIPSGSMEPTIQIGDHVLVDKRAYDLRVPFTQLSLSRTGEPRRGEVVVFLDPRNPGINLIKRVVALPGDRVNLRDGVVWVNGRREQTPIQRLARHAGYPDRDLVVPKDSYFFLGDNRDNSADSREWGFARREALLGRARLILYSVKWDSPLPQPDLSRAGITL